MVTSINLGNFSNQNGRNVVTGSSSGGIDTEALMKGLAEAKRLPAVQLEKRIEANGSKTTAYGEMKDILTRFKDAANFLRNPPGVQNESDNIFEYRNSTVTNTGATAGSSYLTTNIEPGTAVSSYTVTVDQLATFNIKITDTFALATADTLAVGGGLPFNAGAISLGAAGINVTIGATDTLNQIASKINAVSDQSKVSASVIKVSDGNYRLALKTTETGAAQNYASPVLNVGYAVETNAVDAIMTVDGTSITRSSNAISDVVDGITFNLLAVTPPADDLTVKVTPDTEITKSAIFNFVDAYNEFRIFAAKQMETGTDGRPKETAVLTGSSTLRSVMSRVNAEVASVVNGIASGNADRLADIGITFSDFPGDEETPFVRNVLNIDEDKLDAALAGKFEQVRNVFEFDYTSDNPNLNVFSRSNSLAVSSVTLDLQYSFSNYTATYDIGAGPVTINLEHEDLSGGGVVLRGPEGSPLAGLVLIYTDNVNSIVDLDMSQGIADRVFNSLEDVLDENNGILTTELETIVDTNERLETEIARIDEMVERYRQTLLRQFSALESAIAQANTLLQSLSAQANAQLAAS